MSGLERGGYPDVEKQFSLVGGSGPAGRRGFLSGHNYANQRQQVSDVSRSTVEMYVERFCRDKPTAPFTEAVYRMSDQYSGRSAPITR